MSDLEVFGPTVTGADVEDAVQSTLELWMETYLRRMERHIGKEPNWLPNPGSYVVTSDFDHFPEEATPAILIMCSRVDKPMMSGDRRYRATFPIRIGVFVKGQDRKSSERLAKWYGAVLREILAAKGSLGDFAVSTCWDGEEYGVHIPDTTQRTFGTAEVNVSVEVRNVASRLGGPSVPLPKPTEEPGPIVRVTKLSPIVLEPERIE